jgi:hypothetical protein
MRTLFLALAVSAAALTGPALAQDAPEGGAWTDCQVSSITAFRDRLVLRCGGAALAGAGETPREFAMELADQMSEPVLRMAIEAKGRGKPLGVLYVKAAMSNPAGCAVDRCRRIAAVELK